MNVKIISAFLRELATYEKKHRCEKASILLNSTADLLENIGNVKMHPIDIETMPEQSCDMKKIYAVLEDDKA